MIAALGLSLTIVNGADVEAGKKIAVKSVKITSVKKSGLTLQVGEKHRIKVKILPKNASNKKLKYSSSDKKVASVSKKGVIKAKKKGKAKITVKAAGKANKKAVIYLNVKKKSNNKNQSQNTVANNGVTAGNSVGNTTVLQP